MLLLNIKVFHVLQMVSLILMLLTSGGSTGPLYEATATAGLVLLLIAALLTVASLADYLRGLWNYL